MFCLSDSDRFFLYPYPTDMRKSFYSLSGIVTEKMGKDVQKGDAFIFILISANNFDSRVINGYFVKISNLNVPYIT